MKLENSAVALTTRPVGDPGPASARASVNSAFLREVVRVIDPGTRKRGRGRPRKPREVIDDMMARRARGDSLKEIGSAYGVSLQAVSRLLRAHLPEFTQAKEENRRSDLAKVLELWRKGLQRRQIARKLQMPLGRVIYLLRRQRPFHDNDRTKAVKVMTDPVPGRRRRRWSADEKTQIVAETVAPGVRVSDIARRWQICPHQLFNWRRQAGISGNSGIR